MPLQTMKDLLTNQLNELYAAETHGAKVLPRLADTASDQELARTLRGYAESTRDHISRLDTVFDAMGERPRAGKAESDGMKGLCQDCLTLTEMPDAEPHVRDAALIAVAQHLDHDEIAGYGCARAWAELLGYDAAASQLQKTLAEERESDVRLTKLAESLNKAALAAAPT